jgi:hypothetical protein
MKDILTDTNIKMKKYLDGEAMVFFYILNT